MRINECTQNRPRSTATTGARRGARRALSMRRWLPIHILCGLAVLMLAGIGSSQTAAAQTTEPILFDFTSSNGQPLNRGDIVESITNRGLTMTIDVESNGDHDVAMIFDTSQPGPDPDLGTPNENCPGGGPGVGVGGEPGQPGENCTFQGNVLIIPNNVGPNVAPNDSSSGGLVTLTFSEPVTVIHTEVLDIEENGLFITFFDVDGNQIGDTVSPTGLGDNSYEEFRDFGIDTMGNVSSMELFFPGSGAFAGIAVVPESTQEGIEIQKLTNGFDADDPNDADVPRIQPGDPITWTYIVTNTGDAAYPADQVVVMDDQMGVTPALDPTSDAGGDGILSPGESWTYVATGIAPSLEAADPSQITIVEGCQREGAGGQPLTQKTYRNIGTVSVPGLQNSDASHWCENGQIQIQKYTNGQDADDPDGTDVPQIGAGEAITWSYVITNAGGVTYTMDEVVVTDSDPNVTPIFDSVLVGDDDELLEPGEAWLYVATGAGVNLLAPPPTIPIQPGVCTRGDSGVPPTNAYVNMGAVTVPDTSDEDNSSYCPKAPGLAAARMESYGWQYTVANDGALALDGVQVQAGTNVAVTCPQSTLDPGAAMECTTSSPAFSYHRNIAWAAATPAGGSPLALDWVLNDAAPGLRIEATINGKRADSPPGVVVSAGARLEWRYTVTNIGATTLTRVNVEDASGLAVTCPAESLPAGAALTCTASGTAEAGPRVHVVNASAVGPANGRATTATVRSYYVGGP